jgi:hypothetical protein
MKTQKTIICATLILLSILAGMSSLATTFDVAADFSATNNPNGVWSYGWSSTLTSVLNLYPNNFSDRGLDVWADPEHIPDSMVLNPPHVVHNGTGSAITYSTVTWQPGQLSLHPGKNGEYSHARWTAPNAGSFDIAAVFTGIDFIGGTTTDVHVLYNNTSLFEESVISSGDASSKSFSTTISVGMGDIIDFAVGYGSNQTYHCDSTALSATIVPEPTTVLLFGLGGLMVMRRRRG